MLKKNAYILLMLLIFMTSSKNIAKINPEEFLPTKEELEVSLIKYYNRILIAVEK